MKNRASSSAAGAVRDDPDGVVVFTVRPGGIARRLTGLVLFLTLLGTAANFVIYNVAPHPNHYLARGMQRFDLGHEPSIPALYSSLALMASACLLLAIAAVKRRQQARYATHWWVLGGIFVLLSIDECVMFHEMVDSVLSELLRTHGVLYFAWVIPGGIFVLAVALAYLGFLAHLDARTRWLFVGAGALFVFGSIGMEMVAGVIAESRGLESLQHTTSQAIEECCEMLGVVLFIYALLDYLARNFEGIHFTLPSSEAPEDDTRRIPQPGPGRRST